MADAVAIVVGVLEVVAVVAIVVGVLEVVAAVPTEVEEVVEGDLLSVVWARSQACLEVRLRRCVALATVLRL